MAIRIVRLGSARAATEGLRLGTVRRPPRGVRKADYARRDYYDLWLPDLAPSARLVARWLIPRARRTSGSESPVRRAARMIASAGGIVPRSSSSQSAWPMNSE